MTPQEKAVQLVQRFIDEAYAETTEQLYTPVAKNAALIAVDGIIAISSLTKIVYTESTNNSISEYTEHYYWQQVKQEIEKL
jgi:hypothetical protein